MTDAAPEPTAESSVIESLMSALAVVYERKGKLPEFQAERPVLGDLLRRLVPQLKRANLTIEAPVAIGSTAIVWKAIDSGLGVSRALKLPRPRLGKVSEIIYVFRGEKTKLSTLNHPNLVRVYYANEVQLTIGDDSYEFPYFVMDYLSGIKDLDEYILDARHDLTAESVLGYFRDVLAGITQLHKNGIYHCDIKPANLLIATNTPALVSDLGYAKHFPRIPKEDGALTTVTYTPQYAHPVLKAQMVESSDSNANKAVIESDKLSPSFDLYSCGRTIQEVLGKLRLAEQRDPELLKRSANRSLLSPYQWQYMQVIALRLLDGYPPAPTGVQDSTPNLPPEVLSEIKYESAEEALEDLEKLLNLYDLEGEVPELNPHCAEYIQIPLTKVPLTGRVKAIVGHPAVGRLAQVTQLGFVSLVYPSATHTRLEHVLGTFASACEYVRALWYDESSCLFRSVMRVSDLEAVLATALLHDLSQYPMAHDLTEISTDFRHEPFLEGLLRAEIAGTEYTLADLLKSDWGASVEAILDIVEAGEGAAFRTRLLHSVISGPLDADKMDYLRRDSLHLGVQYGASIDSERLLRNVTTAFTSSTVLEVDKSGFQYPVERLARAELAVSEKALAAASGMWRARKDMFRQVYWQHTVRAFKAMLAFAVRRILLNLEEAKERDDFWGAFKSWLHDPRQPVGASEHESSGGPEAGVPEDASEAIRDTERSFGTFTGLQPSDQSLLGFLALYGDTQSKDILSRVGLRKPYRRIAVLSQTIEAARYESLYHRFRAFRLDEAHDRIEAYRVGCQERVLDALEIQLSKLPDNYLPGGLTPMVAMEQMRALDPLLLVDIPIKSVSQSITPETLLYVPEDSVGVHVRARDFPEMKEAPVDIEQGSFDMEVGKIRVFVAPEWAGLVARFLTDQQILDIVTRS